MTKTHTGKLRSGAGRRNLQYGGLEHRERADQGPVTVSDAVPAGFTPTAAAGAGWVCNIAAQNVSLFAQRRFERRRELSGHHPYGECRRPVPRPR